MTNVVEHQCPYCQCPITDAATRAEHIRRWHGLEALASQGTPARWSRYSVPALVVGLLLLWWLLSGCTEGFYRAREQYLAARHSTTTYGEYHSPHGSIYCTQTCGYATCRTMCTPY